MVGGWVPGKGSRAASAIGALLLGVLRGRTAAALRRPRRQRLQRARARAPRARCSAPLRRDSSPFASGRGRRARRVFCEPRAGRRGRLQRVDRGRQPAPPRLPGPARGQAARRCARLGPQHAHALRAPRDRPQPGWRARVRPARRRTGAGARSADRDRSGGAQGRRRASRGDELKLSNLDKVLYPERGFTKRDADRLLRRDRAGAAGAPRGPPADRHALAGRRGGRSRSSRSRRPRTAPTGCARRRVPSERKPIDYMLAEDLPTLVWLANLAAIELHTPLARAPAIDAPDGARVRPRPRRPGERSSSAAAWRCGCTACSSTSACRASPRRRAPRVCRSTCR